MTCAGFASVPPADVGAAASFCPSALAGAVPPGAVCVVPACFGTNSGALVLNRILRFAWGLRSDVPDRPLKDAGFARPGGWLNMQSTRVHCIPNLQGIDDFEAEAAG